MPKRACVCVCVHDRGIASTKLSAPLPCPQGSPISTNNKNMFIAPAASCIAQQAPRMAMPRRAHHCPTHLARLEDRASPWSVHTMRIQSLHSHCTATARHCTATAQPLHSHCITAQPLHSHGPITAPLHSHNTATTQPLYHCTVMVQLVHRRSPGTAKIQSCHCKVSVLSL